MNSDKSDIWIPGESAKNRFKANITHITLHIDTLILLAIILKNVSHTICLSELLEVAIGYLASFKSPERQIVEGDNFQSKCSKIQCIYAMWFQRDFLHKIYLPKNEHLPCTHFSSWHFQYSKTQVSGTRSITI